MVRARTGLTLLALALAALAPRRLPAQEAPPPASPPPPADSLAAAEVGPDPVGFLLENRDSLRLAPDVVDQLVQINLDLFRRTRRIQRGIDSITPPPSDAFGQQRPRPLTPEQREALTPLLAARRAALVAARDAAFALLTPDQQQRARELARRAGARTRRTRGGGP